MQPQRINLNHNKLDQIPNNNAFSDEYLNDNSEPHQSRLSDEWYLYNFDQIEQKQQQITNLPINNTSDCTLCTLQPHEVLNNQQQSQQNQNQHDASNCIVCEYKQKHARTHRLLQKFKPYRHQFIQNEETSDYISSFDVSQRYKNNVTSKYRDITDANPTLTAKVNDYMFVNSIDARFNNLNLTDSENPYISDAHNASVHTLDTQNVSNHIITSIDDDSIED